MYSYIIGVVTQKDVGKIALENNGIGYEIYVSNQTLHSIPLDNQPVKIYTYLNVREDEMSLYGFCSSDEKNMFLLLNSVSGIGPKMALGILSEISITGLVSAIASEDIKTLTKIKGLGKKTAERLLLELKEKVSPLDVIAIGGSLEQVEEQNDNFDDAVETLVTLGLSKNEAYKIVKQVATKDMSIEEIISKSLRSI